WVRLTACPSLLARNPARSSVFLDDDGASRQYSTGSSERQHEPMARLEDLTPGAAVRGILPDSIVTVVAADWFGANAIRLTYTEAVGKPGQQLLYRDNEPTIEIAQTGRPWSFDGDGALLRLVSEAYRIRLAYLFD